MTPADRNLFVRVLAREAGIDLTREEADRALGCEHAAPDGPHICDDCAAVAARETERDIEADARDKPGRWVCARCNHARDLPAECGAPTTGWECPACVRRPLSPFEMLGVLDVCHDRIQTTEERRPARTTRLVRLESVVVQTSDGRALVTARRCPGCGVHILSDGGNLCALCDDEQQRKFGRDR